MGSPPSRTIQVSDCCSSMSPRATGTCAIHVHRLQETQASALPPAAATRSDVGLTPPARRVVKAPAWGPSLHTSQEPCPQMQTRVFSGQTWPQKEVVLPKGEREMDQAPASL